MASGSPLPSSLRNAANSGGCALPCATPMSVPAEIVTSPSDPNVIASASFAAPTLKASGGAHPVPISKSESAGWFALLTTNIASGVQWPASCWTISAASFDVSTRCPVSQKRIPGSITAR